MTRLGFLGWRICRFASLGLPTAAFARPRLPARHRGRCAIAADRIQVQRATKGATSAIMSSTISAKGPSVPLRRVASSSNRATAPDSPASRLWDFYACGLVDDNDDGNESEDTEDELETQDWIQFQRQRAQARLADACQRESHTMRATKN